MPRFPRSLRLTLRPVLAAGALLLGACSDDGDSNPTPETVDSAVISTFVDQVVVPTYQELATRLTALDTAARALQADPSATRLETARNAWFAAREPWEESEAFLFGPVDSYGFDPALDSWPVNRTDLDAVLASGDALTPEYVRNLQETQKGFHTVEYLLFGEGGAKKATEFNARQFEYLTAITAEMKSISSSLSDAWTKGYDGKPAYRNTLANAGQSGNTAYPSTQAAAQEMVGGITNILDEVANGKIADPYDAKDPNLVESQFAYNSLSDFSNNIDSVLHAYRGFASSTATAEHSLRTVVGVDSALDKRIISEIDAAKAALAAVPEPFRDSIRDPASSGRIEAAQAAIRKLQATFETEVLPLVTR
ncbi:imelysin family protein [Pyxidicoccus sp. MSG2]|uniref:imelysin family protein n=1 Tax=Pyxidicoccus sp. MSG2 TaxID=2996790 RepID=UPI002270E5A1|nr:imelysin family protein [Pyxidicoccus sp. MSG2]MCY1015253.1 peptidase M75 [Pyxidicoccus sp. MSG2]